MLTDPTEPAVSPETRSQTAKQTPNAICAECGKPFRKVRPHQVFCQSPCLRRYQNRLQVEGRAIIALAKAWQACRNNKGNTEFRGQVLNEMCSIINNFVADDKAAGRIDPIAYARTLMNNQAGRYIDRQRSR